ncbi:MAG: arginine--tRNA ligase [Candidatus ainarchaeum sp.]|nr:arginine--tRNA ligase [Candidatus ainarchaeum sp.]MDD5096362.1 arginine--tRNA ligase [Candidatus ainarchaeum sp.]
MFLKMKKEISKIIAEAAGLTQEEAFSSLEMAKGEFGDLACKAAFLIAPREKKAPAQIASELIPKLKRHKWVAKVEAAGPYMNFFFTGKFYSDALKDILKKGKSYGKGKKKGKAMVEFPSVNPNKPWHAGHLRNALLGDSVARVLSHAGWNVESIDYIDDLGLQVAQSLWGYMHLGNKPSGKFDHWLGAQYVEVAKKMETDKKVQDETRELLKKMEEGNNDVSKNARWLAEECVKAQYATDFSYSIFHTGLIFESDIVRTIFREGLGMVKENNAIVLEKEGKNAGCWVVKLGEKFQKMQDPDKILIRSDGTATYTGKDLIFQLWKLGKLKGKFKYKSFIRQPNGKEAFATGGDVPRPFGKADMVVNVIGSEQIYPQEVIREVLLRLGYAEEAARYVHLAYEHVALPDEKFSGRAGTWKGFTADELLKESVRRAKEKISKDVPDGGKDAIARAVGEAAIRYSFVRTTPEKKLIFKWEEALSLEGNSGPYLQYAYVRARKIMEKTEEKPSVSAKYAFQPEEKKLIRELCAFPELVERSASAFRPHMLADYSYMLAELFSKFYTLHPVLKAEEDVRKTRLAIVKSFETVLGNSLSLLGMPLPDKM